MSHLLWKYYWENDVDRFRRLLAPAGPNSHAVSKSPAVGVNSPYLGASPGSLGTSPRPNVKPRRTSGYAPASGKFKDGTFGLGRGELNSRDHAGLTLLLRASSSTNSNAILFVQALIDHPAIDLYVQDPESGWNALHRSLYSGNISIARLLLAKERADLTSHITGSIGKVGQLIKTKDHEGNSPFDVYSSTIAARSLRQPEDEDINDDGSDNGEAIGNITQLASKLSQLNKNSAHGDEIFVFGSNKNLSLGVGDEDDRQYPERILLQRPDQLLQRFYEQHLQQHDNELPTAGAPDLSVIPTLVRNEPLVIQDVVMSKLHSAILTNDPISNLYISGVGRGGRLGLGDENTQFKFVPIQGPLADKKIRQVALGQNHSMAIAGNGELWTWGLNSDSQLGYVLPPPSRADEEPMSLIPRQVFGPLKKEIVLGVAASAIHSVAHTGSSLYCWGRNVGQLALMDADSRSLDVQQTPRKVAASLLSASIEMVSAIDKATTCLLSNCTVWVFTNYGYNLIKFPFPDLVTNHNLVANSFSTRYDSGRRDIHYITSGGETIAAVTARGDLFTMQLKGDTGMPAGSTTNPVKIKGAVTQPQCIWQSRKDGVASVSVGEHGSVIICTESGAVWRRIKRVKAKFAAFASSSDAKQKDFKFQRVPYITDCVTVKSSTFGAFAAIRKDSKVMTEEISIASQTLWENLGSLLCLRDFSPLNQAMATILSSIDIETDLHQWLQSSSFQYDVDMEICTSSAPNIKIPIHGWLMAGRSSVLRDILSEFRQQGSNSSADTFLLEYVDGRIVLTLLHVDIFTLLNIVLYAYQDEIIPAWKYTREAPAMAHRFRQVRSELMKVATRLNLPKLEAAARLQAAVDRSLDKDLQQAIKDPVFLEDGDVILELDGGEVTVHSQLICQRCQFFEGMFHGRSQGQWLAGRRDELRHHTDQVRIDLNHIQPDIFSYVISFLYGDVGDELFNEVTMATLDEFSELVVEVLSVANELMLDRLSQICQALIGKFVTTRNIANLLNEISPCSVSSFKDTGLEYICLQLEAMLENHLLDALDEELLQELDEKVRDNQLACLPFAKSGGAELELHKEYPSLSLDIAEERQSRVRDMAFKHAQREEEKKAASTFKPRVGSLEESSRFPETPEKGQRRSQVGRNEAPSPNLRSKASQGDMIFDMEEEASSKTSGPHSPQLASPKPLADNTAGSVSQLPEAWRKSTEKTKVDQVISPSSSLLARQEMFPEFQSPMSPIQGINQMSGSPSTKPGTPWASALPTAKLDLKDIMSEASSRSTLTAALEAQATKDAGGKPQVKMSQKERKRQMQMQLEAEAVAQEEQTKVIPWEATSSEDKRPVWKAAEPIPKTSLQEAMSADEARQSAVSFNAKPLVASESNPRAAQRRTASPDTRFPGQGRTQSSPAVVTPTSAKQQNPILVPHSKQYIKPAPKAEEWLGASMIDIFGQQQREQEMVKEAVAKRSLQEIQQEQAFQEWWDQESRRTQEEEARRLTKPKSKDESGGKRGRRGRGGKARNNDMTNNKQAAGEGSKGLAEAGGNTSSRARSSKAKSNRGRS
ncbi:BTB/POZ domain-containing 1-like protein [Cladobotryum mycophilum]|uniref:BTB/POZ domain-containing 1-like protein n=1 Tax=Cladobotryum mycophilum TaxID=491253 RepID=A0ABR0SSD0_9HYPO